MMKSREDTLGFCSLELHRSHVREHNFCPWIRRMSWHCLAAEKEDLRMVGGWRKVTHQSWGNRGLSSPTMMSPPSEGESELNVDTYQIGDRGYKSDKYSSFWRRFDRSDYFNVAPWDNTVFIKSVNELAQEKTITSVFLYDSPRPGLHLKSSNPFAHILQVPAPGVLCIFKKGFSPRQPSHSKGNVTSLLISEKLTM